MTGVRLVESLVYLRLNNFTAWLPIGGAGSDGRGLFGAFSGAFEIRKKYIQ